MESIVQTPKGVGLLVVRGFNTDLAAPDIQEYDKTIVEEMATEGLEDIAAHFFPRHLLWKRYGRTWSMIR